MNTFKSFVIASGIFLLLTFFNACSSGFQVDPGSSANTSTGLNPTPTPAPPSTPPVVPDKPAAWFVATTGNDGSTCATADQPCRTLDAAYQKANGGDVIELAAGSYPVQTLSAATKDTNVLARPARGASVVFSDLNVRGATYIEIRDITTRGYSVFMNSNFITLRNVTIDGAFFYLGGSNLSMIGGSVGPGTDVHSQIAPENGWQGQGMNFLFDGVYFHDFKRTNAAVHIECLQVAGTTNMVIKNSKFKNCDVFDLSFTTYNNAGLVTNLQLENNVFDTAGDGGYFSVNLSNINGMNARFNSASQGWVVQGTNMGTLTFTANNIVGGILDGGDGACVSASGKAVYSYNVTQGQKCGATDTNAAPGFVNGSALDFHLTSTSAARDFVPNTVVGPTQDIENRARPQGPAQDAGAYEL